MIESIARAGAQQRDVATEEPQVQEFRLLPEQTTVRFTTRHLAGLGKVAGSVRLVEGRMTADVAAGTLLTLDAVLDMASFDSRSAARDKVVASPAFLDSGAHPNAVYRSETAERTAAGWLVHGTLTVKGIAAPVDLAVDDLDPSTALDARATARLDRFAYGISFPAVLGSRSLQVEIAARAERVAR